MRLVVCIDRDDDLGRKAGVAGPVVGRQAVLDAAMRLGAADPEDSDTNAMFAAVNLLDELRKEGGEYEVAVLTGDERVGVVSDRRIATEFTAVLSQVDVSSLYLVSDGAEDEHIIPILASRKPVDSVRRIYIRQSATLQGTYYTVVRALKDRKLRFKTVLPLATFLLFLGLVESLSLFYGLNIWSYGAIFLLIFLGIYLLIWTFDVDEWFMERLEYFGSDLRSGSVAAFLGALAAGLFIIGILLGESAAASSGTPSPGSHIFNFLNVAILWSLLGAVSWEMGSALKLTLSGKGFPSSFWVVGVSITAFGVESYSLLYLAASLLGVSPIGSLLPYLVGVALGIAMGTFAGVLRQYLYLHEQDAVETSAIA